jgi:hypothetical protein
VEIEVFASRTTAHTGGYFEWSGSTGTMVKYYQAGGGRRQPCAPALLLLSSCCTIMVRLRSPQA